MVNFATAKSLGPTDKADFPRLTGGGQRSVIPTRKEVPGVLNVGIGWRGMGL